MNEIPPEQGMATGSLMNPYLSAAVALTFPGAGHFLLGRKARALAFSVIVLGSVAVGLVLGGKLFAAVPNRPLSFLATLAEMGMGLPYFLLRFGLGYQGNVSGVGFEYGKAFILTGGLMNLLLVLDVWDIARGAKE